ncbi:MAG: carboxylating nicotinate-nucleotide diphosphorylase [Calditrichaeota bacterium]|nr:carboxylating nicotinate-nucleotide diphosphorylase [Calditrichota bacterium]
MSEPNSRPNRTVRNLIRRALREDLGEPGDITTRAVISSESRSHAVIISRLDGVVSGIYIAAEVFREVDRRLSFESYVKDGETIAAGARLCTIAGHTSSILTAERTALNFLMHLSGIATQTRRYVEAVAGTKVKICETRKTLPGLRMVEKGAVRDGGGVNHRYSLYSAFLFKENHLAVSQDVVQAVADCRAYAMSRRLPHRNVMVEVRNYDEFQRAAAARPDRILLDNMTVDEVSRCVADRPAGIALEATGGITLENVRIFAETGVDYISVGALTHSASSLDLSLLIENDGAR